MRRHCQLFLALFFLTVTCAASAAARAAGPPAGAGKVCLVLSGGGARGAAHVGVLRVLEELRVPVDCIVGTSAGAAIGGLYASGLSPDEIARFLRDMDWDKALRDGPVRANLSFRRKQDDERYLLRMELGYADGRFHLPRGFLAGRNLDFLLKSELLHVADVRHFDRLPIPFRAVATDIETGEMVVLEKGDLATALRASMAVPGVFAPVEVGDRLLMDGGLTRNLPVEVAREMGADVIIAVNVGTPLLDEEYLGNVVGLSLQVVNVLTQQNVEESIAALDTDDILIEPRLAEVEAASFQEVERAMVLGAIAARAQAPRLQRYAVEGGEYWRFLVRQRSGPDALPVIREIRIRNNVAVSTRRILSRVQTRPGSKLELETLERDLEEIYQMGDFESVSFAITGDGDAHDLIIEVEEKSWGPHYLRFGLQIAEDFEGGGNYNLVFGHTRANLNPLGGEWKSELQVGDTRRVYSEFFQPINYRGSLFLAPQLEYRSESLDLFQGSRRVAEYRDKVARLALDTGVLLGNAGQLKLGLTRGEARTEPRVGALDLPTFSDAVGAWRLRLDVDTRDHPHFPRQGLRLSLAAEAQRGGLGADREYERLHATASLAHSLGANTLVLGGEYGTAFGTALPLYDQFELGGFASLSGFRHEQLRGDEVLALRALYYRRVYTLPAYLGDAVYLGGSIEAGNVWPAGDGRVTLNELQAGGALFVGVDSILGPAFLGFGVSESGDEAFYLFIGKSF